jgi:hypothetical protein
LGALAMDDKFKLSDDQISKILDRVVPLIAAPDDQEFFRGILRIKAENSTSSNFASFIGKLISEAH